MVSNSCGNYRRPELSGVLHATFGLPQEALRSFSAVIFLSLSPMGQSLNDVLDIIVEEIVHAETVELDGTDPYERNA